MVYRFKEGDIHTDKEEKMLNRLNHLNIFDMGYTERKKLFDYFGDRITCTNVLV